MTSPHCSLIPPPIVKRMDPAPITDGLLENHPVTSDPTPPNPDIQKLGNEILQQTPSSEDILLCQTVTEITSQPGNIEKLIQANLELLEANLDLQSTLKRIRAEAEGTLLIINQGGGSPAHTAEHMLNTFHAILQEVGSAKDCSENNLEQSTLEVQQIVESQGMRIDTLRGTIEALNSLAQSSVNTESFRDCMLKIFEEARLMEKNKEIFLKALEALQNDFLYNKIGKLSYNVLADLGKTSPQPTANFMMLNIQTHNARQQAIKELIERLIVRYYKNSSTLEELTHQIQIAMIQKADSFKAEIADINRILSTASLSLFDITLPDVKQNVIKANFTQLSDKILAFYNGMRNWRIPYTKNGNPARITDLQAKYEIQKPTLQYLAQQWNRLEPFVAEMITALEKTVEKGIFTLKIPSEHLKRTALVLNITIEELETKQRDFEEIHDNLTNEQDNLKRLYDILLTNAQNAKREVGRIFDALKGGNGYFTYESTYNKGGAYLGRTIVFDSEVKDGITFANSLEVSLQTKDSKK